MKLKKVVENLNTEKEHNSFKLSELAAKRSRSNDEAWVVVRFINKYSWRGYTGGLVELYECIPYGWPLADVALRLDCNLDCLEIVSRYNGSKWTEIQEEEK